MAQTYAEQLDSVQAAIIKVEQGDQAATVGTRSYTRANLKDLYDREKWLRGMVAREARGGSMKTVRAVPTDG